VGRTLGSQTGDRVNGCDVRPCVSASRNLSFSTLPRPYYHPHHGRRVGRAPAELEPSLESLCLGVAGLRPQDCDKAATVEDCDTAAAALEECGAATLPVAAHVERAHACGFKVHSTQT